MGALDKHPAMGGTWKVTPYRRGICAGWDWWQLVADRPRLSTDPRPDAPVSPYTNRHSTRSFQEGVGIGVQKAKAAKAEASA